MISFYSTFFFVIMIWPPSNDLKLSSHFQNCLFIHPSVHLSWKYIVPSKQWDYIMLPTVFLYCFPGCLIHHLQLFSEFLGTLLTMAKKTVKKMFCILACPRNVAIWNLWPLESSLNYNHQRMKWVVRAWTLKAPAFIFDEKPPNVFTISHHKTIENHEFF